MPLDSLVLEEHWTTNLRIGGCMTVYVDNVLVSTTCRQRPDEGSTRDDQLSDSARAVITLAYFRTVHDLGCVGIPGAGLVTGGAAFKLGQPVPGSKPFTTPGSSPGTSPASETLRNALPQTVPTSLPTPVGGPGTGTPLRIAWTNKLGAIIARYLPFAGAATAGASAYKANQCLSSKPE